MVVTLRDLPELRELDAPRSLVRIPPELDVPLTRRVAAIVDTAAFRRLASISQLGLVSLVYPAAHHRRFEHSLGVYRLALLYLRQLSLDDRFCQQVTVEHAERFLLAALLHDVGHWPFCHLIEDMRLAGIPHHEQFARQHLMSDELATVIRTHWKLEPASVADLLDRKLDDPAHRLLASMLSGPIDVDKMDYLQRDSLHAGVPYGRNFDQSRLIASLCLNEPGDGLALTDKGRTAAEMMVFARYVMFSEVYWHHAVRSATAMLQRAFYELHSRMDLWTLFHLDEATFIQQLRAAGHGGAVQGLLDGLFGAQRRLYKRWLEYSCLDEPAVHARLARQSYPWLVEQACEWARRLTIKLGREVRPEQILIDAPPQKLEVQFQVPVLDGKRGRYRLLGELSPMVRTLAQTQFDDYVKRVRVFVAPELIDAVRAIPEPEKWLQG